MCCHLKTLPTGRPDTDYEKAEHIYNCPQDTEEKTITVPDDQPLSENHTPYPLESRILTHKGALICGINSNKHHDKYHCIASEHSNCYIEEILKFYIISIQYVTVLFKITFEDFHLITTISRPLNHIRWTF